MAKPDGRVESGQPLKRAISAQRWNDLCDAADIVHGRRGGVTAGGKDARLTRLVMRMRISNSSAFGIGTVVEYNPSFAAIGFDELASGDFAKAECPVAKVYEARQGDDTTYPYSASFGVTLAAGENDDIVPVVIAGYAVCRLNYISGTSPVFAQGAIVRSASGQTAAELQGCLETTNCGCGAIAKVLFVGGGPNPQWAGIVL